MIVEGMRKVLSTRPPFPFKAETLSAGCPPNDNLRHFFRFEPHSPASPRSLLIPGYIEMPALQAICLLFCRVDRFAHTITHSTS